MLLPTSATILQLADAQLEREQELEPDLLNGAVDSL